jgi:uncharacterized protein (TIGR01370 family)
LLSVDDEMTSLTKEIIDQKPNPATKRRLRYLAYLLALFASSTLSANRSTAFYYGKPMPIELLSNFEQVVVEPDNLENLDLFIAKGVDVFAYLSVGEVNPSRPWFTDIKAHWILGKNPDWGSQVVDLNQREWHDYLINKVMAPLWERGYRGFFLDTLDSYQLISKDPRVRLVQQQALTELIRSMHNRFPGIKLILNRGFELLPEVAKYSVGVAAESLFQSWNPALNQYTEVAKTDNEWLLQKLTQIQKQYGLQIIVIDYIPPKNRDLARDVADKITGIGFTPWVSNPAMDMLGIGSIEVSPKRFLTLYDGKDEQADPQKSKKFKLLTWLLNLFGYTMEYLDANEHLPNYCLVGKYTAILNWVNTQDFPKPYPVKKWLDHQIDDGIKVIALWKY